MDLSKLELLESRITQVVKWLSQLREQNTSLKKQVHNLKQDLGTREEEMKRLKQENQALSNQEEEIKHLSQERDIIKDRLEGMLETLNQLNID
jgi:chromosome segregation ATPase